MKFHIFEEAIEQFNTGDMRSFANYVIKTNKKVDDIIDSTKPINKENTILLLECCSFSFVWEYMFYYGDKHTIEPNFLKTFLKSENTYITVAVSKMYDLQKKISSNEHEKNECKRITKQILDKIKEADDGEYGIEIVNAYCKENDLNPLCLLIAYESYFAVLSMTGSSDERISREEQVKKSKKQKKFEKAETEIDNDNDDEKIKTITTNYEKGERKKKKEKPVNNKWEKIKEQKAYYIYTIIFLIYFILLYLFSPNSLQVCVGIGIGLDAFVNFITCQVSLNGHQNNWLLHISVAKLVLYLLLGLTSLIFNVFNPIVAIILFVIAHIYGFIKL